MTLFISDQVKEKLEKAKELSRTLVEAGLEPHMSLENQLEYLRTYANSEVPNNCHVVIGTDFAPHSFSVVWYFQAKPGKGLSKDSYHDRFTLDQYPKLEGYVYYMNGGLIFHGKHDGGGDGGAPTFSVNLTPTNGWGIHT